MRRATGRSRPALTNSRGTTTTVGISCGGGGVAGWAAQAERWPRGRNAREGLRARRERKAREWQAQPVRGHRARQARMAQGLREHAGARRRLRARQPSPRAAEPPRPPTAVRRVDSARASSSSPSSSRIRACAPRCSQLEGSAQLAGNSLQRDHALAQALAALVHRGEASRDRVALLLGVLCGSLCLLHASPPAVALGAVAAARPHGGLFGLDSQLLLGVLALLDAAQLQLALGQLHGGALPHALALGLAPA